MASHWLKQKVGKLVDSFKLWPSPQLDDVVCQRHQLPFVGGDQGSLLLPGEGNEVVVMEP